jgi:hypothetical protein
VRLETSQTLGQQAYDVHAFRAWVPYSGPNRHVVALKHHKTGLWYSPAPYFALGISYPPDPRRDDLPLQYVGKVVQATIAVSPIETTLAPLENGDTTNV